MKRTQMGSLAALLAMVGFSFGVASSAQAQTATFSNINDADLGSSFDSSTTAPDPANPNRLVIGFHSGFNSQWINTQFKASTAAFHRSGATDTMCMRISAEDGYYISGITYSQFGFGSILRTGSARGSISFVVNDLAAGVAGFGTNPTLARTFDLTGQGETVVRFCVTPALTAFATVTLGSASITLSSAQVVADLLPLP